MVMKLMNSFLKIHFEPVLLGILLFFVFLVELPGIMELVLSLSFNI
jgi:hypothetical protein